MNNRYENAYVLNVLTDDHPGIIAAVSDAVTQRQGNIDSCSQTVLGGYFTLIMIASFPEPAECDDLVSQIRGDKDKGFQVSVVPYVPVESKDHSHREQFVLTAIGKDKPGIVRRLSKYLAGKDINIEDLYWDHDGDDFVLVSQVSLSSEQNVSMLQSDLEEMGNEEGFTARCQHENIFVATNQLRLPISTARVARHAEN